MAKAAKQGPSDDRKQEISWFWNETQAEGNELGFDVKKGAGQVPRQRKSPQQFGDGSVPHVYPSAEDMYRQQFYKVVDTVYTSPGDMHPSEMWRHMAHIEQFLTRSDRWMCRSFTGNILNLNAFNYTVVCSWI